MKNFDKWINRYSGKFNKFKKIKRQFDKETYVLRFYQNGTEKLLGISILDDGDEWDEGIYNCSDGYVELIQFEDFKEEEELWRKIKQI